MAIKSTAAYIICNWHNDGGQQWNKKRTAPDLLRGCFIYSVE